MPAELDLKAKSIPNANPQIFAASGKFSVKAQTPG
jgi:hypothetical protein